MYYCHYFINIMWLTYKQHLLRIYYVTGCDKHITHMIFSIFTWEGSIIIYYYFAHFIGEETGIRNWGILNGRAGIRTQIQMTWKPPLLATALFCLQYPEHWQVHSRTSINNHWINVLLSPTYNSDIVLGTRDNAKMSMT